MKPNNYLAVSLIFCGALIVGYAAAHEHPGYALIFFIGFVVAVAGMFFLE